MYNVIQLPKIDEDMFATLARFILQTVITCVRFRHLGRATPWEVSGSMLTCTVTKGKRRSQGRRPGFTVCLVRELSGCSCFFDLLVDVQQRLKLEHVDCNAGMVPDLLWPKNLAQDVRWRASVMPREKFLLFLQLVLEKSQAQGPRPTYNSLRRWMPTLGNCFLLDDTDANAIGIGKISHEEAKPATAEDQHRSQCPGDTHREPKGKPQH